MKNANLCDCDVCTSSRTVIVERKASEEELKQMVSGYFVHWKYVDGGSFSALWNTTGQVHQQIDDLLHSTRKVKQIKITMEGAA